MSEVKLSWQSAEVQDAQLTVGLDGELPDGWKDDFERTIKLLGDGEWGEIKLHKGSVRVTGVAPGSEDKLRHHLEALVDQANAADEARTRESEDAGRDDQKRDGPDGEMTARFRAFAKDSEESEASEKKKEDSDGER